jgi:hypothetical protein
MCRKHKLTSVSLVRVGAEGDWQCGLQHAGAAGAAAGPRGGVLWCQLRRQRAARQQLGLVRGGEREEERVEESYVPERPAGPQGGVLWCQLPCQRAARQQLGVRSQEREEGGEKKRMRCVVCRLKSTLTMCVCVCVWQTAFKRRPSGPRANLSSAPAAAR